MDPEFWLERWREGRTGFHQSQYNPILTEHFPRLGLPAGSSVLVPLCGKSLDMLWLREQGHRVLGVELSELAVEQFIEENGLDAERAADGPFARYSADGIDVLCGDIFELGAGHTREVAGVFDRAALIALPPEMRASYARHIAGIVPAGWRMLLLTLDYDAAKWTGPPFPVSGREVRELYAGASVAHIARNDIISESQRFRDAGMSELFEEAWIVEDSK